MDILLDNEDILKKHVLENSQELLRHQRHDYIHLFQIVYDYLQLNKRDKGINQIRWINSMATSISKAYRISIFSISMLLEEKIKKADNYSLKLVYNVYSKLNKHLRTVNNENQIIGIIDNIFDVIIKEGIDKKIDCMIIIDIHEYEDNITFEFQGDVMELFVDSLKDIYPYAVLENNIVKIKLKYQNPRGLNVRNNSSAKPKKKEFKAIDLHDYL